MTTLELVKQELPQFKALIALNARAGTDVETIALQELEFFQMHTVYKPELLECLVPTVIMAIKAVIKKNLSLDPSAGLVYVKTRSLKIKENGVEKWAKALEITETANGLISVNRQCGTILDIERPEVKNDSQGKVIGVSVKYLVPSFTEQGKPSARWKIVEFDESDFHRWKLASHKENSRYKKAEEINNSTLNWANPNYTNFKGGPDPEFVRAKAIRHGLKKLGTNPHERMSRKINLTQDISHELIIDPEKDAAATSDDITIIEPDDARINSTPANVSEVKVTTHEIVNIETIQL